MPGPAGRQGPQGEPGVGGFYTVEGDEVGPNGLLFFTAVAFCDPGDVAVSGGFRSVEFGAAAPDILSSASFSSTDWTVEVMVGDLPSGSIVAQVVCADVTPD